MDDAKRVYGPDFDAPAATSDTARMPVFSAIELLQALVMLPSLLLSAFLIWKRRLWPLAAFLGLLGLQLGWNVLLAHGFPGPPEIGAGLDFAYGPLMLALVRHLSWRDRPALAIWHGFPSVLVPIALMLWPKLGDSIWWLVGASATTYLLVALHELELFHRALRDTHSAFETQSLTWLRRALLALLLVFALDVIRVALRPYWPASEPGFIVAIYLGALGFVCVLVWRGLQQPAMFTGINREERAMVDATTAAYADTQQRESLLLVADRIRTLFQVAKPHLDPDLTVQRLADLLGLPAKQVSMAINQQLGRNFNDFVNAARVETACALLRDPARRNDKLLAIQLDAGFGSRTVFNAAFKRETGMTPSEWRHRYAPGEDVG